MQGKNSFTKEHYKEIRYYKGIIKDKYATEKEKRYAVLTLAWKLESITKYQKQNRLQKMKKLNKK